jgi:hypothetical protein
MRIRDGKPSDRNAIVSFDYVAKVEPERVRFIE